MTLEVATDTLLLGSLPSLRNRTLNAGRAERNEYILLHEFHRLKYVCPDTFKGKNKAALVKAEADEDGVVAKGGKRDKYKGGLVFEPKRGLWDKYVLVMDFNSLYPSIIQEYNIDFTTLSIVTETDAEGQEVIPEVPSSDVPQGVLPRIIAQLVNRRREVKSLMKGKGSSPMQMMQVSPPAVQSPPRLAQTDIPPLVAVGHPPTGAQADCQLDVRLSRSRVRPVLRPTARRAHHVQGTGDPHQHKGARGERPTRGQSSVSLSPFTLINFC